MSMFGPQLLKCAYCLPNTLNTAIAIAFADHTSLCASNSSLPELSKETLMHNELSTLEEWFK